MSGKRAAHNASSTTDDQQRRTEAGGNSNDEETPQRQTPKRNRPRIDAIKTVGATKWLALETIEYTDEENKPRKWDLATRTTKTAGTPDCVVIIPLLRHFSQPNSPTETILVEQFRMPVRSGCVEFPAGLIDGGESVEDAALRELQEETGYVGHRATSFGSRELANSPGMVNETCKAVIVHVDLDDVRNQNPISNPDDGEILTAKRVPLKLGLTSIMESGTNMPISLLYFFSLGFELGLALSSSNQSATTEAPVGSLQDEVGKPAGV